MFRDSFRTNTQRSSFVPNELWFQRPKMSPSWMALGATTQHFKSQMALIQKWPVVHGTIFSFFQLSTVCILFREKLQWSWIPQIAHLKIMYLCTPPLPRTVFNNLNLTYAQKSSTVSNAVICRKLSAQSLLLSFLKNQRHHRFCKGCLIRGSIWSFSISSDTFWSSLL